MKIRRMKAGLVVLVEIVSLFMALFYMTTLSGGTEIILCMFDLPTLFLLLVLALPPLFANGLAGDFARVFRRNKKENLGDLKKWYFIDF